LVKHRFCISLFQDRVLISPKKLKIAFIFKAREAQLGRAERWSCLGYKFKSYLEQMKKTYLLLLLRSNAVTLRWDKSYISHPASGRIQFTSFSVCLKTFKSSDNIIANIVPNTDKYPSIDNTILDSQPNTDSHSISYALHDDIAVVYPKSEISLVPACENKITIVPVKSYSNTDTMKLYILRDNKAKAGIYRLTHKESGKSYVGSAKDLKSRMTDYFSLKYLERRIKANKSLIYRALLKHGYSAFSLDIL
jgi:hypothetical protein